MLTARQKADYLMQVVKLRKLMILKDNPAFTYQHSNRKQAISRVHSLQDKIVEAAVDNQVYGNSDSVNHQKTVEQTISDALENDRKRVYKADDNRYINTAVKLNAEKYSEILNNRLNIESVKLEAKIEEEIRKSKYNGLSEAEIKRKLTEEFKDTAKLRTANIIRDALHTNEVNIGFIHALQNGFQYKVWNNGRGKGKVRAWHRARFISSVSIDEPFDIFGSYHAEMMYPGDLNGGAENVANCRCWLSYTNQKPSNYKNKGNVSSSRNYIKSKQNTGSIFSNLKNKVSSLISKLKSINIKQKNKGNNNAVKNNNKSNYAQEPFNKDKTKEVIVNGKSVYGVGETIKDKELFEIKYGVKRSELTEEEYKFIRLYSGEGYTYLNGYLREIKGIKNPLKRYFIKKRYSEKWDARLKNNRFYMSFDKSLNVSKRVFDKGKILEEDLVVVRRQGSPMSNYANGDIYHSDSFFSTSISKNVKPDEYGDYLEYIVIPKGTKILYIEGVTSEPLEYEILFNKNVNLKRITRVSEYVTHWILI